MLSSEEVIEQISEVIGPVLREELVELVEIEFRPTGKRWLLRLYIDKPGGIAISDCERVSREVARLLDVEDVIEHPYTLEVSSPGLTRALKGKRDFERYRGRLARIITRSPVDGRNEFRGEIGEVTDEEVEIRGKIDSSKVPLCVIKKAHLEFEL